MSGRNELQARWLHERGLVPVETLREALAACKPTPQRPGRELCELLAESRLISPSLAESVRKAVTATLESGAGGLQPSGISPAASPRSSAGTGPPGGLARPSATRHVTPVQAAASGSGEVFSDPSSTRPAAPGSARFPARGPAALSARLREGGAGLRGLRVGCYELGAELSRGAMGVVFRARDHSESRDVALKFLLAEVPDRDDVERFEREARGLARLDHPAIIRIFDAGRLEGRLFIAMELVEGRDLKSRLDERLRVEGRPPPPEHLLPLFEELAEALAHCHERGVTHRDVKPHNILVDALTGRPKLADFGLIKAEARGARSLEEVESLTRTGELVGTPAFMAPEQFSPTGGFGEVGPASDVWAFGATLFFALTGRPPFDKPRVVEIFEAIYKTRAPSLSSRLPAGVAVLPGLDQLVADCLRKPAAERPSMAEVAERLQALQSADDDAEPDEPRAAPVRLGPRSLALPVILVLGLAGLAGVLGWRLLDKPPKLLTVIPGKPLTGESEVELTGAASRPGVLIRVGEHEALADASGAFRLTVPLEPGLNRLPIRIGESDAIDRHVEVARDDTAPAFVLDAPAESSPREPRRLAARRLEGQLVEEHPGSAVVRIGEAPARALEVGPDGRFSVELDAAFGERLVPVQIELSAVDAVGRTGRLRCAVLAPAALELRRRADELLASSALWFDAGAAEQEGVGVFVAERLGESWRFTGLLEARGPGGAARRIARLVHEPTRVELHLIPGGEFTMGNEDPKQSLAMRSEVEKELTRISMDESIDEWIQSSESSIQDSMSALQPMLKTAEQSKSQRTRAAVLLLLVQLDPSFRGPFRAWLAPQFRVGSSVDDDDLMQAMRRAVTEPAAFQSLDEAFEPLRRRLYLTMAYNDPTLWPAIAQAIERPQATSAELTRWLQDPKSRLWPIDYVRLAVFGPSIDSQAVRQSRLATARLAELEREGKALQGQIERLRALPPTRLTLRPFLIGRHELGRGQWKTVAEAPRGSIYADNLPISDVTRAEVEAWLAKAGDGLRLPGEAEWEYACRAGTRSRYWWGDEPDADKARARDSSRAHATRAPIDARLELANGFGLTNTIGNVAEICADGWTETHRGRSGPEPVPYDRRQYVSRGGHDGCRIADMSCASRRPRSHDDRSSRLGLRVARSLPDLSLGP